MQYSPTQTLAHKKVGPNKLVLGFLVAAVTAIMGTAGVAGAAPSQHQGASNGIGYGGNVNVDLNVNGNNNTITVIVRYIFGG